MSSVGWVYNAVHFPFTKVTHNPDIGIARHAVSIDERRAFFPQNLLGEPNNTTQDVLEVWFAGVHSDVGGSYPESESQLSKLAMRWMLCESEIALLKVNQNRKAEILGGKSPYVAPDPLTNNQHESLHGAWWIAEFWPKILRRETPDGKWNKSLHLNLARRRCIAPNSIVHESVTLRMQSTNYKPTNLTQVTRIAGDCCQSATSTALTDAPFQAQAPEADSTHT